MRTVRALALLGASAGVLLVLQACAQQASTADTRASAGSACDATAARYAVGMAPERELLERLQRITGASTVRTLAHDEMVTKEYRVGRLNVQLGPDGRIREVSCG